MRIQPPTTSPHRAAPASPWGVVGRLRSPVLHEVSGVVPSELRPDALWVHNDSGDDPVLYAIDRSGELLQRVAVRGASAVDWEDVAVGTGRGGVGRAIYVADTGDNRFVRPVVQLYRFGEPAQGATEVAAERIDVRYPDGGARNVEALLVDPVTGDALLVTKTRERAELFRAPLALLDAGGGVVEPVGRVDLGGGLATGGDVSADGRRVVLRTYEEIRVWERHGSEPLATALQRAPVLVERAPESEAVCFARDGARLVSIDEGFGAKVFERAPLASARRGARLWR